MKWIIARLKEKGTQSVLAGGAALLFGLFGLDLTVEQKLELTTLISVVVGFAVSFFKEKTDVEGA